jgi:hypothetical protein
MDYNYKETRAFSNDLVRLKKGNLKLSQKIDDALATIRSEPKQSVDGYK